MFLFFFVCYIEFQYSNSVDPNQMLHFAASELGLHCVHYVPRTSFQLNHTGYK